MHFDPNLAGEERAGNLLGNQYKVRVASGNSSGTLRRAAHEGGPEHTRRPHSSYGGGDDDDDEMLDQNPDVTSLSTSLRSSHPFPGINLSLHSKTWMEL
jgi:hypothetical protein